MELCEEKELNFIQFLDNDWESDHRRAYVQELSTHGLVLAIEPPITIGHFFYRKKLQNNKISEGRLRKISDNLWIYKPFVLLPYSLSILFPAIKRANAFFLKRSLRRVLKQRKGVKKPIVIISHPYHSVIRGLLDELVLCYEVYDAYAKAPFFSKKKQALLENHENYILRNADIVFCSARSLAEDKKTINPNTYFVPNAADSAFFKKASETTLVIPYDLSEIPSPRLGLIGNINDKVDILLLNHLAETHKEWSIICIGKSDGSRQFIESIGYRQYRLLPNIHYLGYKPYDELPGYLTGIDICLLPYLVNEYTNGIYPSKVHQYLAAGKPVVSTALPAMLEYKDVVNIAYSHNQFVSLCEDLLCNMKSADVKAMRISVAFENTIEKRIKEKINLINNVIAKKVLACRPGYSVEDDQNAV